MNETLNKPTVLLLNRNWQAIHVKTPMQAFCMMAADSATALDIQNLDVMVPVKWEDWIKLPVRESDAFVRTVHSQIRVPTVIVCTSFSKVPKRRLRFSARGIWDRDGGQCQYTGRPLKRDEASIDHVVPRSRGGKTSWDNCVLACKEVNARKANRLPHEAGLQLLGMPRTPREMPATLMIRNVHNIVDWNPFLIKER